MQISYLGIFREVKRVSSRDYINRILSTVGIVFSNVVPPNCKMTYPKIVILIIWRHRLDKTAGRSVPADSHSIKYTFTNEVLVKMHLVEWI